MPFKSFYYPDDKKSVWKRFLEVARREGKSGSKLIFEFIERYSETHDLGNPQQRLDTISKVGRAFRAETCQLCSLKPTRYGLRNGIWLGYCDAHWNKRAFEAWR